MRLWQLGLWQASRGRDEVMFDQAAAATEDDRLDGQDSLWRGAVSGLGALVLVLIWPVLLRALQPFQIDYSEGWNVLREMQAALGVPLYGAPPGLSITNYPPLYFHAVAWLAPVFGGDFNLTGRVLAFISLLGLASFAGKVTARLTRRPIVGVAAGLLFLLAFLLYDPTRVAENDPQLPAMVLEVWGFWMAVRSGRRGAGLMASAPLFALAVFCKPNLIALTLALAATLIWAGAWRRLARWACFGLVCGISLYVLTVHIDGRYFLAHLLWPRFYSVREALHEGGNDLLINMPLMALSVRWCWRNRARMEGRMLGMAWAASHGLALLYAGGDGVGRNIFFESLWLDVALATASVSEIRQWTGWRVAALGGLALLPLSQLPGNFRVSLQDWQAAPVRAAQFGQGVALLRASPGPVICENLLMCADGGKLPLYDPYFLRDQIKDGRAGVNVMNQPADMVEVGDTDRVPHHVDARFTSAFLAQLPAHYVVALRTPAFTIWRAKG